MEPQLQTVVAIIGLGTSILAALLASLFDRSLVNGLLVGALTLIASGLGLLGAALGGWIGLLIAILLVALLAHWVGRSVGQRRGSVFVPALWLAYCGTCALGFWLGGWWGLFFVTVPTWFLFWGALFVLSRFLLPLRIDERWDEESSSLETLEIGARWRQIFRDLLARPIDGQWGQAFRSLVTFSLGTNFPYQVLEDRELVERVPGRAHLRFLAGPGIVLTGPTHVPIIWNGQEFREVSEPGLTFTGQRETVYQTMDLRPQLRAFPVEAITRDGIRIRVMTSFVFQLASGGGEPELGRSFPLQAESLLRAAQQQPVEGGQQISWDETVRLAATRSLRRIVSEYRFDGLCASDNGSPDPRAEIRDRLVREVRQELEPRGIDIIGGGIGNLEPEDWSLIDQRIEAWQAEWERRILARKGQARATEIRHLEGAYIRAQRALLQGIREEIEKHPGIDPDLLSQLVALRFVESIEEFACNPEIQDQVPDETAETLSFLYKALKE